jgi:hypothetical protein
MAEPLERRPVALLRVRASAPLLASVSVGGIWDRKGFRPGCRLTCDLRGPVLQGEIGLRGAQLGLGYGAIVADRRWAPGIASDVYAGVAVKGVLARTWDGVGVHPSDQWLLGVELEGAVSRINLSVGLLKTFDSEARRSWEWTGGVGWGF